MTYPTPSSAIAAGACPMCLGDGYGVAYVTDTRPARRSHFQTCPNSAEHRRKKVRR